MKKPTQDDIVLRILMKEGKIDNFRCINERITIRLGAIIHSLKEKGKLGMLDEERSGYIQGTKNYCYYLKKPTKWEELSVGGVIVKRTPIW